MHQNLASILDINNVNGDKGIDKAVLVGCS